MKMAVLAYSRKYPPPIPYKQEYHLSKKRNRVKKDKFKETSAPQLLAISEAQGHYLSDIDRSVVTFGIGSAGTGKTYCATALAGQMLYEGKIDKIVITRPAVEAGDKLGHLPGSQKDKFAPYLEPIREVLVSRYGTGWYESQLKNRNILPVPLGFMQGLTFDNSFVLADEMQNSSPKNMFMLLSRVGKNSKVVVTGDYKMQKMIKGTSGLEDATKRLKGVNGISIFTFTSDDCIRSGIARDIIQRYEN